MYKTPNRPYASKSVSALTSRVVIESCFESVTNQFRIMPSSSIRTLWCVEPFVISCVVDTALKPVISDEAVTIVEELRFVY